MKLATRIFNRERCADASGNPNDYYLTSRFGNRIDPITGKVVSFHNGCDYGTHDNKWPQYALEDGVVDNVFQDQHGAKDIWVSYPRLGYRCLHGHLDRFNVKKGQKVNHSTILGYTGMSGKVTGVHLHLGVKYIGGNEWLNPESFDYQEGSKPTPKPTEKFPFEGKVAKGSVFYTAKGNSYKNKAKESFNVIVQGELNGRYKIYASRLNPNVVYVDKKNITKISKYPFTATIKMGSYLYSSNGQRYKYPAKANRKVEVLGELNGRYKIKCNTFTPNIVYCNKSSIIK